MKLTLFAGGRRLQTGVDQLRDRYRERDLFGFVDEHLINESYSLERVWNA